MGAVRVALDEPPTRADRKCACSNILEIGRFWEPAPSLIFRLRRSLLRRHCGRRMLRVRLGSIRGCSRCGDVRSRLILRPVILRCDRCGHDTCDREYVH